MDAPRLGKPIAPEEIIDNACLCPSSHPAWYAALMTAIAVGECHMEELREPPVVQRLQLVGALIMSDDSPKSLSLGCDRGLCSASLFSFGLWRLPEL